MTLATLLTELDRRQIRYTAEGHDLKLAGSKAALTPELVEFARQHKLELLAHLHAEPDRPATPATTATSPTLTTRDVAEVAHVATAADDELEMERVFPGCRRLPPGLETPTPVGKERETDCLARVDGWEPEIPAAPVDWRQGITPNSRGPLIPAIVRAKLEAIEPEARRLGWPVELLYNSNFRDCPSGLAAVLGVNDEIVEVTPDYIKILVSQRNVLRFPRRVS